MFSLANLQFLSFTLNTSEINANFFFIKKHFRSLIFHLQENIKEWTEFYNDDERQKTFLKIDEWFRLWEDRLQLETCMKDPKRLGNFKVSVAIHTC